MIVDKEKRKYMRIVFNNNVKHRLLVENEWIESPSHNIGLDGMMLSSARLYEDLEKIEIKICHPLFEFNIVPIKGVVIWCHKTKKVMDTYLLGIQFETLTKDQEEYINKLIDHRLMKEQLEKFAKLRNKKKILIVEDDVSLSNLLYQQLLELNYEVYKAFDGQTALSLFQEKQPSLIILDINLPDIQGDDVAKIIKKLITNNDLPKIIVITGIIISSNDIHKKLLSEKNIIGFFEKPFDLKEILEKIKKELK